MRIELFNRSKYRDGSAPGDDVPLIVPGVVYGVFDGATDPQGTHVDGMPAGRLAALAVAAEMASLAADPGLATMAGDEIIIRLSEALRKSTDPLGLTIPPSTTLAVMIDCGDNWRCLLLGDSGIRLNGQEVHRSDKIIDTISTMARVAAFNDLRAKITDVDEVEQAARASIFLGFENAIASNLCRRRKPDPSSMRQSRRSAFRTRPTSLRPFSWAGFRPSMCSAMPSGIRCVLTP